MEGSRKDILAGRVGTEQVDLALIDAEQMGVERHTEQFVFVTLRKKHHVAALVAVDLAHPAEVGFDGTASFVGINKRPREKPFSSQNFGICGAPF